MNKGEFVRRKFKSLFNSLARNLHGSVPYDLRGQASARLWSQQRYFNSPRRLVRHWKSADSPGSPAATARRQIGAKAIAMPCPRCPANDPIEPYKTAARKRQGTAIGDRRRMRRSVINEQMAIHPHSNLAGSDCRESISIVILWLQRTAPARDKIGRADVRVPVGLKSKLISAFVRVKLAGVSKAVSLLAFARYCPRRPLSPTTVAVFTKSSVTTPLLTEPGFIVIA